MVKLSVMYPNQEGTNLDMTYYCNRHIPMVRQLLGSTLKGFCRTRDFRRGGRVARSLPCDGAPLVRFTGSFSDDLRPTCTGNRW